MFAEKKVIAVKDFDPEGKLSSYDKRYLEIISDNPKYGLEIKHPNDDVEIKVPEAIFQIGKTSSKERIGFKIKENSSDEKNTIKEVESEAVYARRGDGKYDEAMDTNNDDEVSYKEYIEYCKEHSQPQEQKSDTRVEETENGEFKATSFGKAIDSYSHSESEISEGKIDDLG